MPSLLGCKCLLFFAQCRLGGLSRLCTQAGSGSSVFPVRSRGRGVRNHFKHSVELVDREGDIVDVLAAVEDFLLAQATYRGRQMAEGVLRVARQLRSKLIAYEIIQRHTSVIKATPCTRDDLHTPRCNRKVMIIYHLWAEAAGSQHGGRHMRASSASIGLRMMLSLLLVRP